MATKSTEKKTSLEPSEVFCAVGLLMPSTKMRELVRDKTGTLLLKWAADDGKKIAKSGITPLDQKFVAMFSSAGDKKYLFWPSISIFLNGTKRFPFKIRKTPAERVSGQIS